LNTTLKLTAQAKINLILDVIGKRADGYHEVEMIMQSIDLADELSFTKIDKGIEIEVDNPQVPTGPKNLVYKAAKLLFDEYGLTGGIKVGISKNIPVAAGLAGGSTNAAATLVAINRLWKLELTNDQLISLGAKLGADVPFCIVGGTVLATGTGTDLEPLEVNPELNLVLVKPPFPVSTAEIYQSLELDKISQHPNLDRMLTVLKEGDDLEIILATSNLLAQVTMERYRELKELQELLENAGAKKVLMSGSGPTMLGFTDDFDTARRIKIRLKKRLPEEFIIRTTKTTPHGIIIK